MSFTYASANIAADSEDTVSAVRWLIQDTDSAAAEIADEEILALYGRTSGTQAARTLATALAAATGLERRYRKQATFSSGGVSVQLGARAAAWAAVVTDLAGQLADQQLADAGMPGGVLRIGRGPLYDDGSGLW